MAHGGHQVVSGQRICLTLQCRRGFTIILLKVVLQQHTGEEQPLDTVKVEEGWQEKLALTPLRLVKSEHYLARAGGMGMVMDTEEDNFYTHGLGG